MAPSDIRCTLCGVSFNIARIRAIDEPREYAWNPYSNGAPGSAFAVIESTDLNTMECPAADRDYPGQKGCMVAFREDVAWRLRGMRGQRRKNTDPTWDEIINKGLEEKRIDLESDEGDEDWVPATDDESDEMSEEEMQYEYESVSESCETGQNTMSDRESDTTNESEYPTWVEHVVARDVYPHGPYTQNSNDWEKMTRYREMLQLSEEMRIMVPDEVRLPWRVPEEPLEGSTGKRLRRKTKKAVLVMPQSFHPLNGMTTEEPERVWEHLAGPDCCATVGYGGNRISLEEMLNCNVVQGILRKSTEMDWEVDSTDEDWEQKSEGRWHLTGLKDNIDGSGRPYPERHVNQGEEAFHFDHVNWEPRNLAMAFHPPCLEVFRRVSLKRNGRIDIDALGDWWRATGDFETIHSLPRDRDVVHGVGCEETWDHCIGIEYLSANPCSMPVLRDLLVSSKKTNVFRSYDISERPNKSHVFSEAMVDNNKAVTTQRRLTAGYQISTLPIEIQHTIMLYLEIGDIASLGHALPGLRNIAETILEQHLLQEMPYLWEFWCDRPYSKWTGANAAAIKEARKKFERQEEEISMALNVLEEEGHHEAHAECKQHWDDEYAERKAKSRIPLSEKDSNFVKIKDIDLIKFVRGLEKARGADQLKGLKNRERIWVDCNMILDRIEALQNEGRILPSRH